MVAAARAAAQSVVARYAFSAEERAGVDRLLDELVGLFDSAEDPRFLDLAQTYAHELPRSLRVFLNRFRLAEREPAVLHGGRDRPYLRLAPYFMDQPEDREARNALDRLVRTIDGNVSEVA